MKISWPLLASLKLSGVFLLLMLLAVSTDHYYSRQERLNRSQQVARLIGIQCQSALIRGNAEECDQILTAVRLRPSIQMAIVFDIGQKPFASAINPQPSQSVAIPIVPPQSSLVEGQILHLQVPLQLAERQIGSVYLQESLVDLYLRVTWQLKRIGLGLVLFFCVCLYVLHLVRQRVETPQIKLSAAAESLRQGDFQPFQLPEVGLWNANEMRTYRALEWLHIERLSKEEQLKDLQQKLDSALAEVEFRRQAEQDLWEVRQYLYSIVHALPAIIVAVDQDMRVKLWNVEAERRTGVTIYKALGRPLKEVLGPFAAYYQDIREAMSISQPVFRERSQCVIAGETLFLDVAVYPLITDGVTGAVAKIENVTQRMRFFQMMAQSQKMMSVGGLAAGMAHEINNPLAGILQSCQLLHDRLLSESEPNIRAAGEQNISLQSLRQYCESRSVNRLIDTIMDSGQRASRIVKTMLGFARKSQESMQAVRVANLLDETLRLAQSDLTSSAGNVSRVKPRYELKEEDLILRCDPTQIQQVLLNLIGNAADAVKGVPDPSIVINCLRQGGYAKFQVIDNGHGIEPEAIVRVFEPFYTTKPPGSGTGLGLAVSYFIVCDNHQGHMRVLSSPNHETIFEFLLPLNPVV